MKELFSKFGRIQKNDLEFHVIFENFAFGEVYDYSTLTEKESILATLASLIACQSPKAFKKILSAALDMDLAPEEAKELLYQSVPYVGFGCAHNFFGIIIKVFEAKGIDLPLLPERSNTTPENRHQKGRELQEKFFGAEYIQNMNDNAPDGQEHFNRFLEGFCFGDFYTRDGLDDQLREFITFVLIVSLGSCENQLRAHTQANLNVGNDKEKLVSAITVIMPYIGFPKTLKGLAIVNDVCG